MSGGGQLGGGGDWLRGGMATVLSNLGNQGVNPATDIMKWSTDAALNSAKTGLFPTIGGELPFWQGQTQGLQNWQNQVGGMMNPLVGRSIQDLGYLGQGMSSPLQGASNLAQGGMQGLGAMMPTAIQNFQSGGWTPQYQGAYNAIGNVLGQNIPGLQTSANTANNLVGNFGQTDFNINAQAMANNMLGQGGWTPQLSMALNPVAGILGTQGNTGQSNALYSGGSPLLASGGQTQLGNNMAGRGVDLYSQQALMNPAQAASIARTQASQNFAGQEQQAEQQALARGGGAGATVANGLQNQGMADFYNQAATGISGAVNNALQQQQGLNLTQQGQGINLAQGAGSLQNALLGTSGGLVQGSGQLANNLFGTGLNEVPSLTNAAANYMSPYVSYGTGGMGNQLGMLGAGSNLASMLQQGQLGGIGALGNIMQNQNQYQLGMGNLQNSMTQGTGNLLNSLFGTNAGMYNQQGQLGLGQYGALTNAIQGAMNSGINAGNVYSSLLNNYFNPLVGISGQGESLLGSSLGSEANLFGGGASQAGGGNPLLGSLMQLAGAALSFA